MTNLPIPLEVIYAGLAGTVLALIVATATNRWSLRVFFLLALRLAIGWHFMFEGLHKIHSHSVGQIETSKPFTSEPYFRVAPGPLGAHMRKQFSDPDAEIAAKVKPPESITAEAFAKLSGPEQAAKCPAVVAKRLDEAETNAQQTVKAEAEKELKDADAAEAKAIKDATAAEEKALKAAKTDEQKEKAKADAEKAREKAKSDAAKAREVAKKKADSFEQAGKDLVTAAKAAYARWVYGVDARPVNVKGVKGEVMLSAPHHIEYVEWLKREAKAAEDRRADGLGNGYGTDTKRVAEYRTDALAAEADLVRTANNFVAELRKDLNGGKAIDEPTPEKTRGQRLDEVTMWFLVVVGACLMAGLFTRLACLLGAGFLVMTYLLHPPFPWFPQPPGTEGNPLFVNKNVIECLALLVLMCYPTGRWLGLDALVLRPFCKYRCPRPAA
jgi:uncharacterized membrane protein YphA (DoxX/SURF4 family)